MNHLTFLIILLSFQLQAQVFSTNHLVIHDFSDSTSVQHETLAVIENTGTFIDVSSPLITGRWNFVAKVKKNFILARNENGELALIGAYSKRKITLLRIATGTKYYDFYVVSNTKKRH